MTLGAADLATKEDLHGVAEIIQLHVAIPEVVADGGVVGGVAGGGEHLANEHVPWFVVGEGLAQPNMPAEAELLLLCLHAEEVARPVKKMAVETGRAGEAIDEICVLVRGGIIEEIAGFLFGGDASDDAEISAAEEGACVDAPGGFEFRGLEVGCQQRVDAGRCIAGLLFCEGLGG